MSPVLDTIGGVRAYGFASLPGGAGWIALYDANSSATLVDFAFDSSYSNIYAVGGYHFGVNAIKFNSSGGIAWQTQNYIATNHGGGPSQMALDSSNNIYSFGTMNTYPPGNSGGHRATVSKWNSDGSLLGSKKLNRLNGGNPDETCAGGALNSSGQPIATGRTSGGAWPGVFSVDASLNTRYMKAFHSSGSDNFFRSRFDGSGFIVSVTTAGSGTGNVYKMTDTSTDGSGGWKKGINSNYGSEGVDFYDVALSASSSATTVWAVGTKWRSMSVPDGIVSQITNAETTSPSAGWMTSFTASGDTWLSAITYDSVKNKIYASGYTSVSGLAEAIVLKLSANGTLELARKFYVSSGATKYNTYINSVKTDNTGQVYLCGNYTVGSLNKPMLISMPASGAKTGNKTISSLTVTYSALSITGTSRSPGLTGGNFGFDGGTLQNQNLGLGAYSGPLSTTGTTAL